MEGWAAFAVAPGSSRMAQGPLGKLRPDLHPMVEMSLWACGCLSQITQFNLVIW